MRIGMRASGCLALVASLLLTPLRTASMVRLRKNSKRREDESQRVGEKKRFAFMIERTLLDRLESIKARTGLSHSEQIRQAIRMWLDSREWPVRRTSEPHTSAK